MPDKSDHKGRGGGDDDSSRLAASERAIDRFLDAAWMERGLSRNTLSAYRTDLVALARWLAPRGLEISAARRGDLLDYIAMRVEGGARPRSTARQLSSFRRFFRWTLRDGGLREDPTAQISMPKVGRPLPKALSEEEVETLLEAGRGSARSRRIGGGRSAGPPARARALRAHSHGAGP
jgi:site-specific recombinase XerD